MPEPARSGAGTSGRGPLANVDRRGRRTLLLLAAVAIAPIVAAYLAYFAFPRESRVNYGTLLPAGANAPALAGTSPSGAAWRLSDLAGRWVLVVAAGGSCDAPCRSGLYATRQARTMQGRERDRVARVLVVTDDAPVAPDLAAEHPDLAVVRAGSEARGALPGGAAAIHLVDPRGNFVLAWPADPDIRRLAKDLERLLRASAIG